MAEEEDDVVALTLLTEKKKEMSEEVLREAMDPQETAVWPVRCTNGQA